MNNLSILNAKRIVIKIGSSLLFSNNKFNSKWLDTFIEDVIFLRKKNVDILIVGGGLSGLLAAKKLAGTNKDVLLIERENELGGILKNSNMLP